jgi:predicted nucleic acid-binding protein
VKIVADTNIIFSCLLNSNGKMGDLLFNSDGIFEFYSCDYMRYEIEKHWDKLKRISKLTDDQLKESRYRIYTKINFINEELIPAKTWLAAEQIVSDIDKDDLDFVALSKHLKGALWTGDKPLYTGLKSINFKLVYNTSELLTLRDKKSKAK